jgi:hypothetical protein
VARIRTIKPEFFKHEGLYDLEISSGLPIRIAFAGLWGECDREGRFEWRPRRLKAAILPYDELDFAEVLAALDLHGFVVKYEVAGASYGCIPSWRSHQVINTNEKASVIPPLPDASRTRAARVTTNVGTLLADVVVEGEGKGREQEQEGIGTPTQTHGVREGMPPDAPPQGVCTIARTDADLIPFLEAWNLGVGDQLTWNQDYWIPCEFLFAARASPALVRDAAKAYVDSLSKRSMRSFKNFAREFDRWKQLALEPAEPILSDQTKSNLDAANAALRRMEAART